MKKLDVEYNKMINPIFKITIPPEDTARNLACYNGKVVIPKGKIILAIESGGWTIESAPFILIDEQKANILDRNLLPNIGIKLVQKSHKINRS